MKKKKNIFVLSGCLLLLSFGVAGKSIHGEAGVMKSDAGITFVKGSTEPTTEPTTEPITEPTTEPSRDPGTTPSESNSSSSTVVGHEKPLGGKNLPSTGEKIIQVLPWIGLIMLAFVAIFYLSRNRRREKK